MQLPNSLEGDTNLDPDHSRRLNTGFSPRKKLATVTGLALILGASAGATAGCAQESTSAVCVNRDELDSVKANEEFDVAKFKLCSTDDDNYILIYGATIYTENGKTKATGGTTTRPPKGTDVKPGKPGPKPPPGGGAPKPPPGGRGGPAVGG